MSKDFASVWRVIRNQMGTGVPFPQWGQRIAFLDIIARQWGQERFVIRFTYAPANVAMMTRITVIRIPSMTFVMFDSTCDFFLYLCGIRRLSSSGFTDYWSFA